MPLRQSCSLRSVNDFLTNSVRTDLIGPEMWTASDNEQNGPVTAQPDISRDKAIPAQLPHQSWQSPTLGLPGLWCYGHQTDISDIIQIQIDCVQGEQSVTCQLKPVRHIWTPAGTTTYFRSLPQGTPGEYPFAGLLTVKERKCITADNVFVSELTLINDHRLPETYRVKILTPHFKSGNLPEKRLVCCKTVARALGQDLLIDAEAALIGKSFDPLDALISFQPHDTKTYRYAFALDTQGFPSARKRAQAMLDDADFYENNARHFDAWFEQNVPPLHCHNQDLLKLYYYRWFVVYRAWHNPRKVLPNHPYSRPAFYESPIGRWFGCVIGLSVPVQIQESAWLRQGSYGEAHIRNWAEAINLQYRSYIQYTPRAIWTYFQNHPDHKLLAEIYQAVKEYVLAGVSQEDPSQLPVMAGSWQTGAEYQPNFYQFTNPQWDWRYDEEGRRQWGFPVSHMIRPDEVTFRIANLLAASQMAARLAFSEDAQEQSRAAHAQLDRLKKELWDQKTSFFYAAHPKTGALANQAPCYDGFVPFMWNTVRDNPYLKAFEKFFDPTWFWAEFPITTTAKFTPMYWSGNCIAGPEQSSVEKPHPYTCCWNGPTWHFSNSLAAEALGAAASTPEGTPLRAGWLEFMSRWTEMHFIYGDRSVPCALEHVRPTDGTRFRTIADYFHSAWIDPFMRYWAGIRPDVNSKSVLFDPFTDEDFELSNVCVLRQELSFAQKREGRSLTKTIRNKSGDILARSDGHGPLLCPIPG